MPLQGSLGNISLADVLQTALAGSRSGELIVTRGAERVVLQLSSDELFLTEPEVLEAEDVLRALADRGELPPEASQALGGKRPNFAGILDGLLAGGAVPEAQVQEVVAGVVEDTVLALLTWHDGAFRFQEGVPAGSRANLVSRVGLDVKGVLLRAAQRMDERRVIERTLGSQAVLFRAQAGDNLPPHEPDERLGDVHARLDGNATTDEIALRLGMSRFDVLKALAALVEAGAARAATPAELNGAVADRLAARRLRIARDIAIQWATDHPGDADGLRALVRVAEARERPLEIASALCVLGERLLDRGQHAEALAAFQDALARRPGDTLALDGQRRAAQAVSDPGLWQSSTLQLARIRLEEDDALAARDLAGQVLARASGDLPALHLAARACAHLKDRDGLLAHAEAVIARAPKGPVRRTERDAAAFCRDAVALLAPERSDLLRELRRLSEERKPHRRRVALVAALVVVAGAAGVLTWPSSASGLLSDAQEAVDAGRTGEALALVERILEEFPQSPEAGQAVVLQARLVPGAGRAPKHAATSQRREPARALVPDLVQALQSLPAPDALAALGGARPAPSGKGDALPSELTSALSQAIARLGAQARERRDVLASTAGASQKPGKDIAVLRDLVARASTALDPAPLEALKACVNPLQALVELSRSEPLRRQLREMQVEVAALTRAIGGHNDDILALRRMVASLELDAAHAECRERGPRLLVAGQLVEADALYKRLEALLDAVAADKDMIPVRDEAQRKHMPDFVRERRALVTDVLQGIESARIAAASGNADAAAAAYQALAERHYTIRFDTLVRVPLQVDSVPAGASVLLNGKLVGTAPLRMEYPWGGPTTLTVEATGFDPLVTVLDTNKGRPLVTLTARLMPVTRWSAPLTGRIEARPLDVGGNLLIADRAGRISLHGGADGRVLWTRDLKSLEGCRGRAALSAGCVVAAFLDGKMAWLDARDGTVLAEHDVPRPTGDLAAAGDLVAVAVGTPAVLGLRRGGRAWETPVASPVTAGIVAAHGAFWLGTASGQVLRLDPASGTATPVPWPTPSGPVVGLAPTSTGVLVTTGGGHLAFVEALGRVRWTVANLGELQGAAAEAAGRVIVADRAGRLLFHSSEDGVQLTSVSLGSEAIGGLVADEGVVAAGLSDGRLWVQDAHTLANVADAPLSKKGLLPPVTLGKGALAIVSKDGRLLVVPFVKPPAIPAPAHAPASASAEPATPEPQR